MSRFLPPKAQRVAIKYKTIIFRYLRFLTLTPANWVLFRRLICSEPKQFTFSISDLKNCKVACVLDEFSYESFKFEANFQQINPKSWKSDIESFKPDFVLIESAWRGKQNLWIKKISEISNEIIELLDWADQNHVPTVFWHKEVPPHFSTFMTVSKMFDFIFLTDGDCIESYKEAVGHQNVFLLPFACQPAIHNPIQDRPRQNAMIYAGTFYPEYKYPDRYKNFMEIFEGLEPLIMIDIYDRSAGKGMYTFPEKFRQYIRGSLPFSEVSEAYRAYEYGLNMNSVKNSNTMCSRRVFELIASNTIVVGNDSKAVKNYFGDLTISSDSKEEVIRRFVRLKNDPEYKDKIKLQAIRKIFSEHTYKQRLQTILRLIHVQSNVTVPSVLVLASDQSLNNQTYPNKHLLLDCKDVVQLNNEIKKHAYVAIFDSDSFYSNHYLTDMILAFEYAKVNVVTKNSFYKKIDEHVVLTNQGQEYQYVQSFVPSRSVMTSEIASKVLQNGIADTVINEKALSVDRFNFCQQGKNRSISDRIAEIVSDTN